VPDRPDVHYNLTERYHDKAFLKLVDLNDTDFLVDDVYKRTCEL